VEGGAVQLDRNAQLGNRGIEVDGRERQVDGVLLGESRHPRTLEHVPHAPDLQLAVVACPDQFDEPEHGRRVPGERVGGRPPR
jgi:hypothetical protein